MSADDDIHRSRQAGRAFGSERDTLRDDLEDEEFSGASGVLFEQAMAQTRMAICLTDPNQDDNPIVFANRAFRELTGYSSEDILGNNCRFLQGPDTDQRKVQLIRDAIAREDVIVVELLNYRKDGSSFWNALHLGPIYDDAGKLKYFFGSQWDVTDVHAARADELHARLMARELSHRMKNMFAVIGAIVTMTGRHDGVESAAKKINGRVYALGRAHEATLDIASRTDPVDLAPVIRTILSPYGEDGDSGVRLHGGEVRVDSNIVSILGLVLHELATNATKYGALGVDDGAVDISWRMDEDGGRDLVLEWRESGGPAIAEAPQNLGMGSGIITNLLDLADGEINLDWRENGLHAVVRLPSPK